LDEKLEPVGIGVTGELYAGGDGLARGYLNDPALTAHKFIPHPFMEGQRLYRTGDLARWRAEGNIDFLARLDDQVKIRGYRIEPAEIEARLLQYKELQEAIVLARTDDDGDRHLVSYFTARNQVDVAALRDHLKTLLPDYMIPSFFVQLDRLPLTPNGKVDRRALPAARRARPSIQRTQDLPESETEERLLAIWQKVLGQPDLGCTDNFFEHGGHSLNAVKLTHLVHERLAVLLPFTLVFKAPTVRQLAQYILDAARFGASAIDEPLVPLSRQQGSRAIFGFPPGTADALGYAQLAERLTPYAFYAFNFIEVESRIQDYADLIMGVDPAGPYLLFGYSGGGNLAFRTATELESRGKRVSDVVMLDSSRFLERVRFPADEARRLAADFLDAEGVKGYVTSQVLRDKVLRTIERYYDFLSSTQENTVISANIHVVISENSQDNFRDDSGRTICSKSRWAEVTRGQFRTYPGHGDHGHMLHHQYLEPNAALLRTIFQFS
jgi:thioesterase domain-containing protein/acyl carrier protein